MDGAEKDHAARSTAQAGLRVGERCRQSFRAKLSLTSGLKVRVSRMSKRSTKLKDCEREHTKDWTRKARTVRLDVAVALFVSSNVPNIQHLLIHSKLCATDLGRTMMHASRSLYFLVFFAKTFLSLFLDVRPVMLDETADTARSKDGDPCKSPRSAKKYKLGSPATFSKDQRKICTVTTSVNLVSNGQVHRRAPTLPSSSVHFTSVSQWRRKRSRRWCSCVEEHACRRTVPLFGAANEFQLVPGLRP